MREARRTRHRNTGTGVTNNIATSLLRPLQPSQPASRYGYEQHGHRNTDRVNHSFVLFVQRYYHRMGTTTSERTILPPNHPEALSGLDRMVSESEESGVYDIPGTANVERIDPDDADD